MTSEDRNLITLPRIDDEAKTLGSSKSVNVFFTVWRDALKADSVLENKEETKWTAFTVEDPTLMLMVPMDTVNPISGDELTQKMIIENQLSYGKVDTEDPKISTPEGLVLKVLNGNEITLKRVNGELMANDTKILDTITSENATIFVMEYSLFFTHEDIMKGITRIHEREGVVRTPWGNM